MSRVLVVSDGHMLQTKDGRVWCQSVYDYNFYKRYTHVFDMVYVAVRIKGCDSNDNADYRLLCSGENVEFLGIDDFVGFVDYLGHSADIKKAIKKQRTKYDCAIVRMPSAISLQYASYLSKNRIPFALEIVNDPRYRDSNIFLKCFLIAMQKWFCWNANGVAYVSENELQKIYPCRASKVKYQQKGYFTGSYSSVFLDDSNYLGAKKYSSKDTYTFIHIANAINSYGKGHIEAIKIVKQLNQNGYKCELTFVGDGKYVERFLKYANDEGVGDKVRFVGKISDKAKLVEMLRANDLFLFPTHGEGLPRVLLEAMAAGTVCVATKVGSIVEILNGEQMAENGDISSFVSVIKKLLDNPAKMEQLSVAGYATALKYHDKVLQDRRNIFFRHLNDLV